MIFGVHVGWTHWNAELAPRHVGARSCSTSVPHSEQGETDTAIKSSETFQTAQGRKAIYLEELSFCDTYRPIILLTMEGGGSKAEHPFHQVSEQPQAQTHR